MPHDNTPFDIRRELNDFERRQTEGQGFAAFEREKHGIDMAQIIQKGQDQKADEEEKLRQKAATGSGSPSTSALARFKSLFCSASCIWIKAVCWLNVSFSPVGLSLRIFSNAPAAAPTSAGVPA